MAFPVVALIPAIGAALWSGLVTCFKWCVDHYHIVKIIIVCTLICTAFYLGRKAYIYFTGLLSQYMSDISAASPQGASFSGASLLAKANYVLPVSEMFALLGVYIVFAGLCLSLKFIIAGYKALPFKSA